MPAFANGKIEASELPHPPDRHRYRRHPAELATCRFLQPILRPCNAPTPKALRWCSAPGRRHAFALPIAEALGFDLWMISSNGAVTRSTRDEHFYIDFLPAQVARELCIYMGDEFRGNTVAYLRTPGQRRTDRRTHRRTDRIHPALDRKKLTIYRVSASL